MIIVCLVHDCHPCFNICLIYWCWITICQLLLLDYFSKQIANLETVEIPIVANVTGCPLGFKMATLKGQLPIVRFGTHVAGLPPIQRPLQLKNTSPYGKCKNCTLCVKGYVLKKSNHVDISAPVIVHTNWHFGNLSILQKLDTSCFKRK